MNFRKKSIQIYSLVDYNIFKFIYFFTTARYDQKVFLLKKNALENVIQ